jgi:hypothetical protein
MNTELGMREELRSGPPVSYLNKRSHGQNLRSTTGQAEPIAQYFFKYSQESKKKAMWCIQRNIILFVRVADPH